MTSQSPADSQPTKAYRNAWEAIGYMVRFEGASWSGNERNCLYLNLGGDRFANASSASGADWADDARCAVPLDWDGDGRLDLLIKNRTAPRLRLLHNRTPEVGHWLAARLVGEGANREAIGARVRVSGEHGSQARTVLAGEGYLAQPPAELFFGLGPDEEVEVEVTWPDGKRSSFGRLEAGAAWQLARDGTAERIERAPATLLAQAEDAPPEALVDGRMRVVLAQKLPIGPLSMPGFDAPERRVSDVAGVRLINLWATWCGACRKELGEFRARRAEIEAAGITIVPLSTDEGPELAKAREVMADLGWADVAGYADGRTLKELEVVMLDVLGSFDEIPMPTSFLVDGENQLVAVYLGAVGVDQLLADAAVTKASNPRNPYCGKLGNGLWLRPRMRRFEQLSQAFRKLGREDLYELYRDLVPE